MSNKEAFAVEWSNTLTGAFQIYKEKTSRSSGKVEIIHKFIGQAIEEASGNKLTCLTNGRKTHMNVRGAIYPQDQDVLITKEKNLAAVVSVKFVMQNYAQNAHNYLQNLIGECVNIKLTGKKFIYILIMPEKIPHYKKDGTMDKLEKFTADHQAPYDFLGRHAKEIYAPDWYHIEFIKRNHAIVPSDKYAFYEFIKKISEGLIKL